MTKTQKVDLLLDAIGMIGDDIIAESSGISNILPIPSKLKINLMVMRRLIAAALCLMIISAITPLSVYLYNNYIAPAFQPTETTEETVEETVPSTEESRTELTIPEGYSLDGSVSFEMISTSTDGSTKKKAEVEVALLKSNEDSSPATYIELRTYGGESVTDTLFEKGCGMVILSEDRYAITVFNTEITFDTDKDGYAKIVKYNIYDGEFYESIEFLKKVTYFTLLSDKYLEESRVTAYNMFIDFSEELERQGNALLILDSYTADIRSICEVTDSVPAPNITEDRKSGKTTWTIDRIGEVNGFVKKEAELPENYKTYETEDGWLISGMSAEPKYYRVVGCTDKIGKTATLPTKFNGYEVIVLEYGALQNCLAETLIIPEGYVRIEKQILCGSIRKLIIECGNETEIEQRCFGGLPLEEVIFTGSRTVIERELFYGCSELKKVLLPVTLETVSQMAFLGCGSLENITLPNGVKVIEKNAFGGCKSFTSIILPASVEKIGDNAFSGCRAVENIEISSNIGILPSGIFHNHSCESITIPEGIRFIEDMAVESETLRYLYLPSTLEHFVTYRIDSYTSNFEAIYYNGTMEDWSKVFKPKLSSSEYNEYTIYCTDGEIVMFPGGLPMQ